MGAAWLPKPKRLVTAPDVVGGGRAAEAYLKGAQSLGVPAAECPVIEDAPAGIRAGKAAGARVLALRTTASDEELQEAGADWIINDCGALFADSVANGEVLLSVGRRRK